MPCKGCPDSQMSPPTPPPTPIQQSTTNQTPAAPCQDCPDHVPPRDGTRPVSVIVYTGGPAYAPFANVDRGIMPDQEGIVTKWSRPHIHPRGEIEYQQNEAEPPRIEGYEPDASNSRLLCPIWPHCVWRILRVWREDTGAISISAGCLTPASGVQAYESLKLSTCQNCAVRAV